MGITDRVFPESDINDDVPLSINARRGRPPKMHPVPPSCSWWVDVPPSGWRKAVADEARRLKRAGDSRITVRSL